MRWRHDSLIRRNTNRPLPARTFTTGYDAPSAYGGRDEKALQSRRRQRGRKASEPKRGYALGVASSSTPIREAEVARLTHAVNEARDQQTGTADVLRAISSSLKPVFASCTDECNSHLRGQLGELFLA